MSRRPSRLRRLYEFRYAVRLCILAATVAGYFAFPQSFSVLTGLEFFRRFSWLHVLWAIWVLDMAAQLAPSRRYTPLGSLKHFERYYRAPSDPGGEERLSRSAAKNALDSANVLVVWMMIVATIGIMWTTETLGRRGLLLVAVVFYVLDMTFILFWCPFRVWIMKNRCCTTCRIYNWDHMMMFSPLVFIPSFYSLSLFGLAAVVFLIWEVSLFLHPERLSDDTNAALRCTGCTDRLCGRGSSLDRENRLGPEVSPGQEVHAGRETCAGQEAYPGQEAYAGRG